jgi:protein-disulfide isomerase
MMEHYMRNVSILMGILFAMTACQREDPRITEVLDKLDKIDKRLDGMKGGVQAAAAAAPQRPRGPDPNTVYNVPVLNEDVTKGAKVAKVTIVEGFDFACPYCAASRPAVEAVLAKHPEDVRVVSKQFVVHPQVATLPALAVCAAHKQGKGVELENEIWARSWKNDEPTGRPKFDQTQLTQESIEKAAADKKLDVAKLKADMQSSGCQDEIMRQQRELATVGVNGTPAFFINGKPYMGARSPEAFNAAVEEEIKKVDAAVKGGQKLEDYYANLMKGAQKSL